MRLIIPMAGIGKRMRPHTLTTPKPLLPIAGKAIVQRLVEGIAAMCEEKIEEITFVIGHFGKDVEGKLMEIAASVKSKGRICYQEEALGTAHAVQCASDSLKGKVIVAFADTLFYANFNLDEEKDAIIWVQKVEDPRQFGVVKVDKSGMINEFVEKPQEFVSDLAIIGIYYFKSGENLKAEIDYLISNNIQDKGEYQLTDALQNMKKKGLKLFAGQVDEWLDCGNKDSTVYTNKRVLEREGSLVSSDLQATESVIVDPCYIGKGVVLKRSVIGPFASIGDGCNVEGSVIENSILQKNCIVRNEIISNSMLGNHVETAGKASNLSIGDYNRLS